MLIYFIRHSETAWNALGRLQGESDVPLSDQGKKLAELTAKTLSLIRFDKVIISPSVRAKETAEIIAGRKAAMETDERIREITWGDWDGLTAAQIKDLGKKKEFDLFYANPFQFKGAPGGETIRQVCQRGESFFQDLTARDEWKDDTILVVTHGCAVRGILNHLYDDPSDFWQGGVPANCSTTIVKWENGKSRFIEKDRVYYDQNLIHNHYMLDENIV